MSPGLAALRCGLARLLELLHAVARVKLGLVSPALAKGFSLSGQVSGVSQGPARTNIVLIFH